MSTEGTDKNMEVCLKDLSKIILGKYEVICDGKALQNTEENAARKLVVKGISVTDGMICVQVMERNIVPNDMDAPWVKEHFEQCGNLPNLFDGC